MKVPLLALAASLLLVASRAAPGNQVVLDINSSPEYPRNSEGAFATLKSGRIVFYYTQFYGGHEDVSPARITEIHSDDQGLSWSQPRVVIENIGKQNVMSVSLLRLASGRLAFFYGIKNGLWDNHPYLRISADDSTTWSSPTPVIPSPGYFSRNNDRVIQTRSGRLIYPVAFYRSLLSATPVSDKTDSTGKILTVVGHALHERGVAREADSRGIVLWYLSDNEGASWREADTWWALPVASENGLQEPGVVELADGSLYGWARTDQGEQYSFWSHDDGKTWTAPVPSELKSPCAPASIKRLPGSEALLAIYNDHSGMFPVPPDGNRRTPLVAAISTDGGKTWPLRKVLEADPNSNFAYTAIHFIHDSVLLAYSHSKTGSAHLGSLRVRRIALSWLPAAP